MSETATVSVPQQDIQPEAEELLRSDRLPHIWCPECGIGIAVSAFVSSLTRSGLDLDKVCIVSGIGCTGRVAGYMKLDSFHTTHGRAIPFATGLALSNPSLKVVVFSGDGDLISIGGNHFIHAARRNVNLTVICVNNFNYAMTGGQVAPTTPIGATCSTSPFGNAEQPFNLAALAASSGAVYVARWTTLHVRRLIASMEEALAKPGFSFVECISACPTLYTRRNKLGTGLDWMHYFRDSSDVCNGVPPETVDIRFKGRIPVGKFVDIDKPTYLDSHASVMTAKLGEKYKKSLPSRLHCRNAKHAEEKLMARYELRVGGFGGQGVILTGYILGKAAAVNENRHATMNQAYGPEARGSACSSSVVVSDEPVTYPYTRGLDVLLVMNQESYRVFKPEVKETGTILVDDSLVTPDEADKRRTLGVPAARIAEKLGKRVVTNMVMLGFLAGTTEVVTAEALREAIRSAVPPGTEDLNLKAFDAGYDHGVNLVGAEGQQEVTA